MSKNDEIKAYIEIFYIDDQELLRKTGIGQMGEDDSFAHDLFRKIKNENVEDRENGKFIFELYDKNGDGLDSVILSTKDFEKVTGEKALTDNEYIEFDKQYWLEAKEKLKVWNAA